MAEEKKTASKLAGESKKTVKVKNISKANVPLSTGIVEPGKEAECSLAEARNYLKYLEVK